MTDQHDRRDVGARVRREVLGSDYVDRTATTTWAFAEPFAELMTEYAWGAVWARPGLGRRDRSLVNLGMLAALNRTKELRIHLGAALTNGLTPAEIQEVILQIGVYCGAPAAIDALDCARIAFAELGIDPDTHPAERTPGAGATATPTSTTEVHADVRNHQSG